LRVFLPSIRLRVSFLVAVVGVVAGVVVPRNAAAAPAGAAADSEEEKLLHEGVDARRQRDDAKALELFQKAYALHASPRAAAQMGLAEIALGRWPASEAHLEEAIAASNDPWIDKNSKSLRETLTRVHQHVGRLEVLGGPTGAEVVIAGEAQGRLPLTKPIRVRAGDVRFEVRAKGYEPETRTVRVEAGQLTRETVVLGADARTALPTRARMAPTSPLALAARDPATAPGGLTGIAAHVGETPRSQAGAGLRTTGVVLGALGVAAVGAGAVFGWKVRSLSDTASGAHQHSPAADINGSRYETLEWIGYGAGAALLIGGVISYLVGASK
jgi:PEGA domain